MRFLNIYFIASLSPYPQNKKNENLDLYACHIYASQNCQSLEQIVRRQILLFLIYDCILLTVIYNFNFYFTIANELQDM